MVAPFLRHPVVSATTSRSRDVFLHSGLISVSDSYREHPWLLSTQRSSSVLDIVLVATRCADCFGCNINALWHWLEVVRYTYLCRVYTRTHVARKRVPDEQHISGYIMSTKTCRRIEVARSGYMLTVSRRRNYYSFMSRSTCIPLYPATDGR